ncbi:MULTISPECIES: ABC transporter permease subunit [unclassified Rhizobium]|uniref:ABC transporter permease n=1 Tax=unclassified Rhizobium TaxID=2613769 RepID=UPI0006F5530A|nr:MULTISPECIES: ABC transporter permease subunit [unclassified Rhizobium]KQV33610.1 ABC transporter permease [Rhizobium sp. Root1212]KRD23154.1 ABC transporter permease [Rhizobium sp. Root268]
MDFAFLFSSMATLLAAVPTTLILFSLSVLCGGLLGLLIVTMRVSGNPVLRNFAKGYIFVFRGSPLMIQMFLVFYGLGQFGFIRYSFLWPFLREPMVCAILSLALCTAGYSAEIFRSGIRAVSPKEIEAGRAIGMSGFLLVRRIIAPIAFRHALPAYSTEIVLMMKSTALASLVTVWEVTGVAQRLISQTYRTMEVFLCAAVIYLVLNFIILQAMALLEYSLSRHRRPAPSAA